ncbi:unnamed protein product [Echinostoma caproni]|uniref:Secreted protein n=1 Tax=Echinostoma caproni TaxID=27848 RepID=A0A183BH64_9TREM|nr:unnamed protein product [Echinostoma caproni]
MMLMLLLLLLLLMMMMMMMMMMIILSRNVVRYMHEESRNSKCVLIRGTDLLRWACRQIVFFI